MAKLRRSKPKPPAPNRRPVLVARHRAAHRATEALDLNRCERFLQHEAHGAIGVELVEAEAQLFAPEGFGEEAAPDGR